MMVQFQLIRSLRATFKKKTTFSPGHGNFFFLVLTWFKLPVEKKNKKKKQEED